MGYAGYFLIVADFIQWANDLNRPSYADRFVVFTRPEAIHTSMRFFESWAHESSPTLVRNPFPNVR